MWMHQIQLPQNKYAKKLKKLKNIKYKNIKLKNTYVFWDSKSSQGICKNLSGSIMLKFEHK